jgi:hypothetical protein
MSSREMQNLLTLAAQELRQAASCFESIVKLKGDDDGAVSRMIERQRKLAALLVKAKPEKENLSPALGKWSEGMAEAMENYRPGKLSYK